MRTRRVKQLWLYEVDGGQPSTFAVLWEWWDGPEGKEPIESCTDLTSDANVLAGVDHNRMPVILDEDDNDG